MSQMRSNHPLALLAILVGMQSACAENRTPSPPLQTASGAAEEMATASPAPEETPSSSLLHPAQKAPEEPFTTDVMGCLASGEEPLMRSASPLKRVAPGIEEGVRISMSGPRITVAHDLQHACCLKATTKMEKGDGRLVIEEVLSGTPCRCLCHSTLRHSIRLAPGEWTIVLQLRQPDGAIATVHEETLPVRSLRPGNQSE